MASGSGITGQGYRVQPDRNRGPPSTEVPERNEVARVVVTGHRHCATMRPSSGIITTAINTEAGRIRSPVEIQGSVTRWLARRDVWLVLSAVGFAILVWNIYRKVPEAEIFGMDARAYWLIDPASPYGRVVGAENAFLYAPPFASLFGFAGSLSWESFRLMWLAIELAALVWLARGWTLVVLAFPPVINELFFGNINLLIAVAITVGFRWAGAWSFIILTKVTPGVGLIWFAVRREWRALATAISVTAAIVAVSFLVAPGLWRDWFTVLATSDPMGTVEAIPVPLLPRVIVAGLIIGWGGLTDRRWTVPVGSVLALPVIWSAGLSILVALVPLAREAIAQSRTDVGLSRPLSIADRTA